MKKVFTAPSVVPCDMLKSLLESNGITSIIKNERGSAIAGVGYPVPTSPSPTFAWPEIWVHDDDFGKASEIASQVQSDQENPDQEQ